MSDDHNQEVWVMAIILMTDWSSPNFIYYDAADSSSHYTVYRVSSLYTPIERIIFLEDFGTKSFYSLMADISK